MDGQSEQTNVVQPEVTTGTAMTGNSCAPTISDSDQPNVTQQQMETTSDVDVVNASSASANVSVTTIPDTCPDDIPNPNDEPTTISETCPDDIPNPNDEPQIDVPLLSDCGQRVYNVRVSLSEFCKLPVNAIINSETNEMLSPTGDHDLQLDTSFITTPDMSSLPERDCSNFSSSSIQMPGDNGVARSSGGGGQSSDEPCVIIHRTLLATQVGIDNSGTVRRDFPFDGKDLSLKEKRFMSGNTLLPPKKRLIDSSGDTMSSGDASHIFGKSIPSPVFGKAAAELLATQFVAMAAPSTEEEDERDASAELYSDNAEQSIVTSNVSEVPKKASKLFPEDTTLSRELFPEDNSTVTNTSAISDNKNTVERKINISMNEGDTLDQTAGEETSPGGDTNTDGDSHEEDEAQSGDSPDEDEAERSDSHDEDEAQRSEGHEEDTLDQTSGGGPSPGDTNADSDSHDEEEAQRSAVVSNKPLK